MNLVKLTKTQVQAYVQKHGETDIYMVPCKMYPTPQTWYIVTLVNVPGGWIGVKGNENRTFDDQINAFEYYNCTYETGYYTHFYVKG
jgi:hypothetical protein